MFALCLSVTACKNNANEDASATDTLSNMNTTMQDGTATDMNGNSTGGATGTENTGTANVNNNAARPASGESEVSGANSSSNIKRRDTAGFAESGQYNSDIATPKPKNLDDKKYRDNPPNHSYGDTAPKARPQR